MANGKISGDPITSTAVGLNMAAIQGGANVQAPSTLFAANQYNLADLSNPGQALTNIGGLSAALASSTYLTQVDAASTYLTIAAAGSGYQPLSANLTAWSAVNPSSYSTTAQIASAYQPLDSDLTSWASVTRAAGFDTFAAGPSSANLKALLTDETGSGAAVFATSPTLVTPALGTPSALVLTNATGLPVAGGGTGIASYTIGDILYASGATTLSKLAKGTGYTFLRQNAAGTAPEWAAALPGYDTNSYAGANESARLAALIASAPTNPYAYHSDSHLGIIRDTAPLNYQGTRAAFVLQRRDAGSLASNELAPGAIYQFTSTGDGVVTAGSDLSLSISMGLTATHTKTGDGSAHPFTAIGQLGAYGTGLYNELGLFVGTGTNIGSSHGTMSGVEVLLRDSPDAGVTKFDTTMNAVIGRTERYNAGTRKTRNFYASNEGTAAADAVLGVNTSGFPTWVQGIDLVGATFSSGQAMCVPNNTSIASMNAAASARRPLMFLSSADELWLLSGSTTTAINFGNSALATALTVNMAASMVNKLTITGAVTTASPVLAAAGSDTNIPVTVTPKGAASTKLSTSLARGATVTKNADFTLGDTENWLIVTKGSSCVVTFPAASAYTGREVMIKTTVAFTTVSATSNVVPLAGGAAATAILAATAGKWATLVSDGTNWVIMAGN